MYEAFWSQDGRQVLTNDVRANWNIGDFRKYELEADGSFRRLDRTVELDAELGSVYLEAWNSVDDLALLWGPRGSPSQGLQLVDLETGAVRQLTDVATVFRSGTILPDGRRILFRRINEILLLDSETREVQPVFVVEQDTSGALAEGIALSRDGRQLAILAKRDEGDVWVMDLESAARPGSPRPDPALAQRPSEREAAGTDGATRRSGGCQTGLEPGDMTPTVARVAPWRSVDVRRARSVRRPRCGRRATRPAVAR